ncbi:hypothetical protein ACTD5D_31845 [Nocardia takedensis]|uniref:hypothetical protein n=1 Tax=Nocardia takedensis TaxID=259390 RepID=UPI003F758DFF
MIDHVPFAFWARDDLTMADTAGFGPSFTMHSGSVGRVTSGHLNVRALGSGAGKTADWGEWRFHPNTDDVQTRFMIVTPAPYTQATDSETLIVHRGSDVANAITHGAWLALYSGSVSLYSVVGGTQTQRSGPVSVDLRNLPLMFQSKGNVHQLIREDTGATVVGWTDTGNVVLKGPGYQRVKVCQTGNHPFAQPQYGSPAIEYLDVTAA